MPLCVQAGDYDKEAYKIAEKASRQKSWDSALALLTEIQISKIDNSDVIEYVVFSKKLVNTAKALGVDIKSDPSDATDVGAKLDWTQLTVTMINCVKTKGLVDTAQLFKDAWDIRNGIDGYYKLDAQLAAKYK